MQRDTDLTFKDIFETPNAILKNIQEIYQHSTDPIAKTPRLDLRFLSYNSASDSDPILHLTELSENIGETNYVAVSYTWQRFNPVDDTIEVPRYKICDHHLTPNLRDPRSQSVTLHRAVQFARAYSVPFIWIDQECIDQQDSADIERHLHIVHKIFHRSRYAIGLLSFHVPNESCMRSLQNILEVEWLDEIQTKLGSREPADSEYIEKLKKAIRILTTVSADKWFSRAWTLMERLSAPHMRLLLPCEPALAIDCNPRGPPAEFELGLTRLQQIGEVLKGTRNFSTICEEVAQGQPNSLRNNHGVIETFSQMSDLLSRKFLVDLKAPPWRQNLDVRHVMTIFWHIEQCDNAVLSDRLLLLGYLCGFPRRLRTEEMNHYKWSYSTCAFVLLVTNGWLLQNWGDDDATFFWNHTFREVLAHGSCTKHQQGGESQKLSQESVETRPCHEFVPSDFIEKLRVIFGLGYSMQGDRVGV